MKFMLDESADARLKAHLTTLGHDVTSIVPDYTAGMPDPDVLGTAVKEQRILITDDKDSGVIFYRLGRTDLATKIAWLNRLLREYPDPTHKFLVITPAAIREGYVP
jgi:predicted nuclease of predicted toxin-antitoxin system